MNLLGLHISDHDTNISLYYENRVRYHKLERSLQIKHYGSTNFLEFLSVLSNWNVSLDEIDDICITIDDENLENFKVLIGRPFHKIDHHLAHALSIWPVTDKKADLSFIFDGDGDYNRSFSIYEKTELIYSRTNEQTSSFGNLLEIIAKKCNIQGHILDLAGKAMGLKSYGKVDFTHIKEYENLTLEEIDILVNSFQGSSIDLLATVHHFAEIKFPEYIAKKSNPSQIISFTGGVSQNSVLNGILLKSNPNIIIPPHGGDEGLSLGCLEYLRDLYNLTAFKTDNFPYWQDDEAPPTEISLETIDTVADLLANGKIVGWYQGHGEVGPRALGNRSILMDPRLSHGKDLINLKVKNRENYRPFGCSILSEHASDYFDIAASSPYMLYVVDVKATNLPAITHIDNTSRIHTVDKSNILFRTLLEKFFQKTGCPILLNTSLNVNGRPIAGYIEDALEIFKTTDIDAMCIGGELYIK